MTNPKKHHRHHDPETPGPLVSCIMTTRERGERARRAIRRFAQQSYPHRELIVIVEGDECLSDLEPDATIRLERLAQRQGFHERRRRACELARGELIAHWGDDEWYATDRLERQVDTMLAGAEACGSGTLYHVDVRHDRWWLFDYAGTRPWAAGPTLMYPRAMWEARASDDWRFALGLDGLVDLHDPRLCVVRIHDRDTAARIGFGPEWRRIARPPREAIALASDD